MRVCQIDDDISAKHRKEVINTPDIAPTTKKKQSKKDKASPSSMTIPGSMNTAAMELMFGRIMNQLTNHIDNTINKHMERCTDICAQVTWTICYLLVCAQMLLYLT